MEKSLCIIFLFSFTTLYANTLVSCNNDEYDVNETKDIELHSNFFLQNATVLSSDEYNYAFGISQFVIVGNFAYVNFWGNKEVLDGDAINNNNEFCCTKININDNKTQIISPSISGKSQNNNAIIGYITRTLSPDNRIASFALMRFNDNNPYYCYAFAVPDNQIYEYETCRLHYTVGDISFDVDYTLNNYRMMLSELCFMNSYYASVSDAFDNINIHYDYENNMYYAVVATNQKDSNVVFPLVLMQSPDMKNWMPKSILGNTYDANEISAIIHNEVLYLTYRTKSYGMRWLVYDLNSNKTLSEGHFDECRNVLSKPDTFVFGQDVYMAVNVYPSVYGNRLGYNPYTVRQEVNIYKIINGRPEFFHRIYNADGINYFCFQEASNGKIYLAYSEDRRHLYRRLFSNISFADVTDLFIEK